MYFSPIFSLSRRILHNEESAAHAFAHGDSLMELALRAHPRLSVVFIRTYGAETVTTKGFDVGKLPLRKPFSG